MEDRYTPDGGFELDSRDPLVDIQLDDSKELWLLQWSRNEVPDFNGKELSLNLQNEGCAGSFEGSVGKTYDMVNSVSGGEDAAVFLSSPSGTRILGKISRRISLVHYVDPKELEKQEAEKKSKRNQVGAGSSFMNSSLYSTPTQSTKVRNSQSTGHTATTNSSRQKSGLSEAGDNSHRKKRRVHGTATSTDGSTMISGQAHSTQTVSR